MNTLVIAVTAGRGGAEFKRESQAFTEYWRDRGDNVRVVQLPNVKQATLRKIVRLTLADERRQIDRLVFFCHGSAKWLRCGWHKWAVSELAACIACVAAERLDVALYACSCGRAAYEWPWSLTARQWDNDKAHGVTGSAGFAARLSGALADAGVDAHVFAHGSRGHTTRNPYCYIFSAHDGHTVNRTPVIERGGSDWKAWRNLLKTDARFDVPFRG